MGALRRFGVFVLFVSLIVTVGVGNVVVASHQTVLDPGYVGSSLDEADAYQTLHRETIREGENPLTAGVSSNDSLPPFLTDVAARAVTPAYLQNQTEANIDRVYAYFHGERSNLTVVFDTQPVVNRSDDAVETVVAGTPVGELITDLGVPIPERGPVNRSTVLALTESEESYRDARASVRASVRDRILTAAVDRAFDAASNDELLALVIEDYDPDQYTEAEKEQMVADRESEIRTALRDRIERERGEEIDRRVNETLNTSRSTVKAELAAPETGLSDEVDSAAGNLSAVFVDGLLAPNYTHAAFRTDLNRTKRELGVALGDAVQSRLDEQLPAEVRPLDGQSVEDQQGVQRARQAVQALDVLGIVLPLAVVGLLGALRLLSGTWATTALWGGLAGLIGAAPTFVAAEVGDDRLARAITQSAGDTALTRVAVSLVDGVLAVVAFQSLAVAVVGSVVAVVGLLVRRGVVGGE